VKVRQSEFSQKGTLSMGWSVLKKAIMGYWSHFQGYRYHLP